MIALGFGLFIFGFVSAIPLAGDISQFYPWRAHLTASMTVAGIGFLMLLGMALSQ
jgi:hypothetical protein